MSLSSQKIFGLGDRTPHTLKSHAYNMRASREDWASKWSLLRLRGRESSHFLVGEGRLGDSFFGGRLRCFVQLDCFSPVLQLPMTGGYWVCALEPSKPCQCTVQLESHSRSFLTKKNAAQRKADTPVSYSADRRTTVRRSLVLKLDMDR